MPPEGPRPESKRILVADDDASFRDALCAALQDAGYETEGVGSAGAGETRLNDGGVDLVVADIEMPGNRQLEFLQKLKLRQPPVPVIIVTGHPTLDTAVTAVRLPVTAYLTKPVDHAELLVEIERVLSHDQPLHAAGERIDRQLEMTTARWSLTPRQREVLAMVVRGNANKDIARTLECAQRTVELHVTMLLEKAGAESRSQLTARFWTD